MGHTGMRTWKRVMALGAVVAAATSCGDVVRSSRSPVLLVVNSLGGIRGGPGSSTAAGFLLSDVITLITTPAPCTPISPCPTVFDDTGDAVIGIVLKDQSGPTAPTISSNNFVTITRVHVKYIRTDRANGGVQGVDVPYEFDTTTTGTIVDASGHDFKFELVRHTAKAEPPLVALITNPDVISTIAQVTFYGTDTVGNAVSVMGQIQVNFGNFGDTQ
jgi:hypothetical protein